MSHTNQIEVYCVADEGIDLSTVHDKLFDALAKWDECESLFGTISHRSIQSVASAKATLYPPLRSGGMGKLPRSKKAKKEPAPYTVSNHKLTVISSRKQAGMVMTFFVGPNTAAAFDFDDYMDVGESAMMGINDNVCAVEDLASDSDGIDGLVYDVMQHAAFYPDNEFEDSDCQQFDEDHAVLVAYYE